MSNFWDRVLGRGNAKNSSQTAKDRLKFVLVHDRINLPPEQMQQMKEEILAVISKYVNVRRDSVDIALEQRDRNTQKIVAEIPFAGGTANPQENAADDQHDETPTDSDGNKTP
jgi:cell division topological specificity factor